jgi:small subunit ribosomal protein S6
MRTYETIFIVHPEVAGDACAAVIEKFKGVVTEQGAEILKLDEWGIRKLAYPVKKQSRGTYVYLAYQAEAPVISEFERRMRIDDAIIKFQTVMLEKGLNLAATAETESSEPEVEENEEETTEEE